MWVKTVGLYKEGDPAVSSEDPDTAVLNSSWSLCHAGSMTRLNIQPSTDIYTSRKDAPSAPPLWSRRLLATTAAAFCARTCVSHTCLSATLNIDSTKFSFRSDKSYGVLSWSICFSQFSVCSARNTQIVYSSKVKALSGLHATICRFDRHIPRSAQLVNQEQHVAALPLKLGGKKPLWSQEAAVWTAGIFLSCSLSNIA